MFRNMLRSKSQKEEDLKKTSERIFPFGSEQEVKTQEIVYKLTQDYTDEPLVLFFYLSAFDKYHSERELETIEETLKILNKMKPKLPSEGINQLLALMDLTIAMETLEQFPTSVEVIKKATNYPKI